MLISTCRPVPERDIAGYAWGRLTQFQNADYVTARLVELHGLPKSHHNNARRQAIQLRRCLLQAKEYYDAAKGVSLATKPVLLYYSHMSLAICEVLFKQSADSRLEKLRAEHGCHGLQLSIGSNIDPASTLSQVGGSLIAKAQTDASGGARGTFEVWRKSSRDWPVCGIHRTIDGANGVATSGLRCLLAVSDAEPAPYPAQGRTFLDVLAGLPQMIELLAGFDCEHKLVRATVSTTLETNPDGGPMFEMMLHPTIDNLRRAFEDSVRIEPRFAHHIEVSEFANGFHFRAPLDGDTRAHFPACISLSETDAWFATREEALNEFGLLYVALHIVGNLCRYYPDKWLAHLEASSSLAIIVAHLCDVAAARAPLLLLGELSRTAYIPRG